VPALSSRLAGSTLVSPCRQPAIFAGVGQRFVAGVDDGAVELHPFEKVVVDVIGALADLEKVLLPDARQFAPGFGGHSRAHPARADVEHAQGQKGQERMDVGLGQRRGPADEVIFMAAEGRAHVMIDVVADEINFALQAHGFDRLQQHGVASRVVTQDIEQAHAFRGAIFQVAHVDVAAAAVEKKSAIAGRFVPIALMHVDQAKAGFLENPVAHARNGAGCAGKIAGQTAVLRLQTHDAIHNPRSERVRG
jgi:hypothetical protein